MLPPGARAIPSPAELEHVDVDEHDDEHDRPAGVSDPGRVHAVRRGPAALLEAAELEAEGAERRYRIAVAAFELHRVTRTTLELAGARADAARHRVAELKVELDSADTRLRAV